MLLVLTWESIGVFVPGFFYALDSMLVFLEYYLLPEILGSEIIEIIKSKYFIFLK
jgi:hypothetical protein